MNNNRSHNVHIAAAALPISGQLVLYLYIIPIITNTIQSTFYDRLFDCPFFLQVENTRVLKYIFCINIDRWREKGSTIEKPIICRRRRSRADLWNIYTPTALRSSGSSKYALGSRSVQLVHSQGPINGRRDKIHTLRP